MKTNRYPHLLFLLLFGIVLLVFLRDFIFLAATWNEGDYGVQHYPWAKFYAEQLKQFRLPLWSDFNHCGFPLFAEGQVGGVYPLNLLLFFLLPFEWAYNGGIVLHFFLAALGMFVYLHSLKFSFMAAFTGALVWVFGSSFAGAEYNLMALRVLSWFPFGLYLIERFFEKKEFRFLLVLTVLYFFQLTAGSIQFAFYAILFSALYFLMAVLRMSFLRGLSFPRKRESIPFKSLLLYGVAVLLAVGLSAVQWLPSFELTRETIRFGKSSIDFALSGSFSPLAMFSLIFPRATASVSGWKIYLGTFPLFLLFFAFIQWRRSLDPSDFKKNTFLVIVVLAAFSLFLALGKFNPIYPFLVSFFHLYFFRAPAKFTIFVCFFLSVLVAYGFDLFLKAQENDAGTIRKARKIFCVSAFASILVFLISAFSIHAFCSFWISLGEKYVDRFIYQKGDHALSLEEYYRKVLTHYDALKEAFSFNFYNCASLFLILFTLVILYRALFRLRTPAVKYLSLLLIFLDLFIFSFYGTGFRGNIASFRKMTEPEWLKFVKHDTPLFRLYLYATDAESLEKLEIPPNANMLYQLSSVGAYSPLITKRYSEYFKELGNWDDSLGFHFTNRERFSKNLPRLNLANVKYIYSAEAIDDADLIPIRQFKNGNTLYQNPAVLPRAFFSEKAEFFADQKSVTFSVTKVSSVEIIKYDARERLMSLSLEQRNSGGWLFLSSLFYPGWRAFVDGREVEIYRANDLFQAIYLKKGAGRVQFLYQPESFKKGLVIFLVTAVVLLVLFYISPAVRFF